MRTAELRLTQFSMRCFVLMLFVVLPACTGVQTNAPGGVGTEVVDISPQAGLTVAVPGDARSFDSVTDGSADLIAAPAPADANARETNLWDRVRSGLVLNVAPNHPRVVEQIRLYSGRQALLDRVSKRASWYLYYIVEQLEARGMPLEIALLPIVESAYEPFAYSHGRAAGLWQFIPDTAKRFGLKQNWWYDARRDVLESTRAALDYLQSLHESFNQDWLLALAAYNAGEQRVSAAIAANRQQGLATDFWSLALPRETRAYVPKVLALAELLSEPDKYNVSLLPIANAPYFGIAEFQGQFDLAKAAELSGSDLRTIYRLNPGWNRWSTDPSGPHRFLLPLAQIPIFERRVAALTSEERVVWRRHTIRRGETLIGISRTYRTTPAALRSVNELSSNLIRAGDSILVPSTVPGATAHRTAIPRDPPTASEAVRYTVVGGDSLWSVAKRHNLSVKQLADWNNLDPQATLSIGQVLEIRRMVSLAKLTTARVEGNRPDLVRRIGYRVRHGDSLWRIANRFRISIQDITRWNEIDSDDLLHPGQALTLYVDLRAPG